MSRTTTETLGFADEVIEFLTNSRVARLSVCEGRGIRRSRWSIHALH